MLQNGLCAACIAVAGQHFLAAADLLGRTGERLCEPLLPLKEDDGEAFVYFAEDGDIRNDRLRAENERFERREPEPFIDGRKNEVFRPGDGGQQFLVREPPCEFHIAVGGLIEIEPR